MREGKYKDDQILAILKEQRTGVSTAEICRRYRISKATFYGWKAKYGGDISESSRLKALEDENRRLKKLLLEQIIENATLKERLQENS